MKLTKQQLKQIIKEEMSSVISEKDANPGDVLTGTTRTLLGQYFGKITRKGGDRKSSVVHSWHFMKQNRDLIIRGLSGKTWNGQTGEPLPADEFLAETLTDTIKKQMLQINEIAKAGSLDNCVQFLNAFLGNYISKPQELEQEVDNLRKFIVLSYEQKHDFLFSEKESAENATSQEEEGSEKTADTDRMLDVLDKVDDEWGQIQNSTQDKKLKASMDYIEKVALSETKRLSKGEKKMKLTKQQLKQIIKEELQSVMESETMSPDDPDYDSVTEAIFLVRKKLPGGEEHSKMMLQMMPSFINDIAAIAIEIADDLGIPQHADYIGDKVIDYLSQS